MWFYEQVTRNEFEERKNIVEQMICELGGKRVDIAVPYENEMTSIAGDNMEVHISRRPIFQYGNEYFRVCEILFPDKPHIVLECGTYEEVMNNTMEDLEPFPYDLDDTEIIKKVKCSLGIE